MTERDSIFIGTDVDVFKVIVACDEVPPQRPLVLVLQPAEDNILIIMFGEDNTFITLLLQP